MKQTMRQRFLWKKFTGLCPGDQHPWGSEEGRNGSGRSWIRIHLQNGLSRFHGGSGGRIALQGCPEGRMGGQVSWDVGCPQKEVWPEMGRLSSSEGNFQRERFNWELSAANIFKMWITQFFSLKGDRTWELHLRIQYGILGKILSKKINGF